MLRLKPASIPNPTPRAKSSYLYVTKFIPRSGLSYIESGGSPAAEFQSEKNVTGYPVLRYAEVLLNWIEAKAELATLGGTEVSQSDIDISINQIRKRPVAEEAKALGVTMTAEMKLDALPQDPHSRYLPYRHYFGKSDGKEEWNLLLSSHVSLT